jgi:hypothetical protein
MQKVKDQAEGNYLIENFICGEDGCGKNLSVANGGAYGVDGLVVICPHNPQHTGFKPRTTALQEIRRTANTGIETIPLDAATARRQMMKLCQRYPDMLQDLPSSALFFEECRKLSLDPLMSPAEAVPVAFFSKKLQHRVIAMIISADGWLSMAARSAPDIWMGAPSVKIVADPVLKKNISGSDHESTIVVEANGFIRDPISLHPLPAGPVYGWFLNTESSQATTGNSGFNMATWRVMKRWVRMYYPGCRQVMMQQTSSFMTESEGIKVTSQIIDAEFHLIESKSEVEETSGAEAAAPRAQKLAQAANAHKVSETKRGTGNTMSAPPGDPPPFEPKELKNLGQFFTACNQRWGLVKTEVEDKLGKDGNQFGDLWDEWETIKKLVEGK